MLKRLSPKEKFEQLVSTIEPMLRKAFLDAIDDITSNIVLRRVVERLERHDIVGAIEAMHLDPAAFRPLDEAVRQAFNGGGVAAVEGMPTLRDPSGYQIVIRWDARNVFAEEWLRLHSSTLITNIIADQQTAIRTTLETGLARGDNPTRTALSVVGRINRATGKREGGIIGLTAQQGGFVENARRELSSGDPDAMRNYLTRGRRDRRFDRTVAKAIAEGKALPPDMVAKIAGRYSDGLLALRGETLARTETMAALGQSQEEAYRQAIAKGSVQADQVEGTWHTAGDNRVRDTHEAINGQKVKFGQPFRSPSGALLLYPGDTSLGAGPSEICNCRCWRELRINFFAGLK
jgi:hypothetical protein